MFKRGISCTFTGDVEGDNCPHCGGALMECDEQIFWKEVEGFETGEYEFKMYSKQDPPPDWKPRPHPGVSAMYAWAFGVPRCFKHPMHMRNSYKKHTGTEVDMTL